jgi:peroxiredoxin
MGAGTMLVKFRVATLLVLVLMPVIALAQESGSPSGQQPARKPAPDFVLRDAKGAEVQLADFKGRVLLLDFWATWCTGCKQEIPWFIEFDSKYRTQGLASVGVAMDDERWQTVKPYLAEHPISYQIVMPDADIAKRYGITNMPVTLLIDRQGRIADMHVGVVAKEAWEQRIQELLRER